MDVDMNSITGIPTWDNYYKYITFNPTLIAIIVIVVVVYVIMFGSLGTSFEEDTGEESRGGLKILGIIVSSIFVVLIVINGFNYFLNIDIVTSIKNFFTKNPEIDIIVDEMKVPVGMGSFNDDNDDNDDNDEEEVPEIKTFKQVYNIPGNHYTYQDARALCKAYGNRLANYKEIENAYNHGADWCNYGWSENQLALFPTQYNKWEKLQKRKGHENDCGRPGINGGYIDNPNIKFGVNCFGYKPEITSQEAELMKYSTLYPTTKSEKNFQKKVEYWRERIGDILVAPFNSNNWSRI